MRTEGWGKRVLAPFRLMGRTERIGKGANLRGYLYTAGDIPVIGSEVSVTTESPGLAGLVVAPTEVVVDAALAGAWYEVSRSRD